MSTHNIPIKPRISGERFLSLKDVEATTSLKKSTIYTLIRDGRFPRPTRLTVRRSGWLASDIEGWITSRSATSSLTPVVTANSEVVL